MILFVLLIIYSTRDIRTLNCELNTFVPGLGHLGFGAGWGRVTRSIVPGRARGRARMRTYKAIDKMYCFMQLRIYQY